MPTPDTRVCAGGPGSQLGQAKSPRPSSCGMADAVGSGSMREPPSVAARCQWCNVVQQAERACHPQHRLVSGRKSVSPREQGRGCRRRRERHGQFVGRIVRGIGQLCSGELQYELRTGILELQQPPKACLAFRAPAWHASQRRMWRLARSSTRRAGRPFTDDGRGGSNGRCALEQGREE